MELKDTMAFVEGCLHEEPAACTCSCPFDFDIKSFLKKMGRGRWSAAYRELSTALVFPAVVSELCSAKCMQSCKSCMNGCSAVNIKALEKSCISFCKNEKPQSFPIPEKDSTVAIVGAGPAGLSCAISLARKKYKVTVFEKESSWGGSLRNHPAFNAFDEEFQNIFNAEKLEFRFGTEVNAEELEAFNAVCIATGKDGDSFNTETSAEDRYISTRPGWFFAGEIAGDDLMEAVASGRILSQYIESYNKVGSVQLLIPPKSENCTEHMYIPRGETPAESEAADKEILTPDEAKKEASRCLQCICEYCIKGCEVLQKYKKTPFKLAGEVCGDANTNPPFSNCEATREVYSCNMCSYCKTTCPNGINMGDLFRYSRENRWEKGYWVPGIFDFWLRQLDYSNGEAFYSSSGKHEYVFFPGCQLGASMPGHVKKAYTLLKEKLDAGIIFGCCGAPAVWAGDTDRRASTQKILSKALADMGEPVIITACTTCEKYLAELFPEMTIISLYTVLKNEFADNISTPTENAEYGDYAVFSPCSAEGNNELRDSVVFLAEKSGLRAELLDTEGKCCGFGGHMQLADPKLYYEITDARTNISEKPYIVYCANCREVFKNKGKECLHVLELLFGQEEKLADIDEKRVNALFLRNALAESEGAEAVLKEKEPWDDLDIDFSDAALSNMKTKLISKAEIAETVFKAEESADYFENEDGLRIACMEKEVLTFWTEYRKADDRIFVEYAYYHRMHINKEGK